jgi:hypothetical protein
MLLEMPCNPQFLRERIFYNAILAKLVFFLLHYQYVLKVAETLYDISNPVWA